MKRILCLLTHWHSKRNYKTGELSCGKCGRTLVEGGLCGLPW